MERLVALLPAGVWLLGAAFALAAAAPEPGSVAELRERARAILGAIEERELPLPEAQAEVERLRRDLEALGEAEGWIPVTRRLAVAITRPADLLPELAEECPLFFEEELVTLCPLDLGRSAIWGNRVLVCEFVCAPGAADR